MAILDFIQIFPEFLSGRYFWEFRIKITRRSYFKMIFGNIRDKLILGTLSFFSHDLCESSIFDGFIFSCVLQGILMDQNILVSCNGIISYHILI